MVAPVHPGPTAFAARGEGTPAVTPADLLALTKPRIVVFVMLTVAAGFALGVPAAATVGSADDVLPAGLAARLWILFNTLVGTAFVAGGTNALNQIAERDVDALMRRTQRRPLPAGRLAPGQARIFAWAISILGVCQLALMVNPLTAVFAALTLASYVFAYTPLKRRTTLATLVGAIPGALPIVGGWTAAFAPLDIRAGVLFGIMFLWQIPHFLALAWMYRADYTRAGLKMLSVDDQNGVTTFRQAALNAVALLPVSLAPAALAMAGTTYFAIAFALSAGLVVLAALAARAPSTITARRLFLATLVYLPALLGVLVADRIA